MGLLAKKLSTTSTLSRSRGPVPMSVSLHSRGQSYHKMMINSSSEDSSLIPSTCNVPKSPKAEQQRKDFPKSPKAEERKKNNNLLSPRGYQSDSNPIDRIASRLKKYRNEKSQRKSRSITPSRSKTPSKMRSPLSPKLRAYRSEKSQRKARSTTPVTPRSIPTAIIASPLILRSRSAEPGVRDCRSLGSGTAVISNKRTRSTDPSSRNADSIQTESTTRSRSAEPSNSKHKRSRSAEPYVERDHRSVRGTRSCSPSRNSRLRDSEEDSPRTRSSSRHSIRSLRSHEPERRDDSDAIPYRLGKDMTILADGMNLDMNTRSMLAAYDAKTLEDFFLMSDVDFAALLQKAKANRNSLPPLQVRKVRMLRRWIKEVVDDNMEENQDQVGLTRKRRTRRIIPKDWKEQYANDLPHLKIQLRQQGDSIFEKMKVFAEAMTCGAGMYLP